MLSKYFVSLSNYLSESYLLFCRERQLCENLQKNKIENAEILDELAAVKEKNAELKKRSSDLEKSEQNLFNKIMALEAEVMFVNG